MKIVMFTDTYYPEVNGVSTSVSVLRETLINNGHVVLIVTTNPNSSEIIYDKKELIIRIPGLKLKSIYDYTLANPFVSSSISKITKLIKEFNADLIHCQTEWGIGMIGMKVKDKLKLPLVYTYHTMWEEYASYVTGQFFNRISRYFLRTMSKQMANKSFEFIAPSIKTKDYMRSLGVNSYINVIPTGFDTDYYSVKHKNKNRISKIKKELGLKNEKVIMFLGRVAKEKGIDTVLKGYCNYINKYKNHNTILLIVGGGPSILELTKLASELGIGDYVKFVGKVAKNDTVYYYHLADVFVSASLSETQGLTYIEAMASSLLCVARYDNNLIDVISNNETGFFFHSELDFPELINKILLLKKDKKDEIITNALKVIKRYSIDNFYNRIINVYERAIRKNW